jgi:hypothetical protein
MRAQFRILTILALTFSFAVSPESFHITVVASPPLQGGNWRVYLPVILKNFPPPATTSRYMYTTDSNALYTWGCNQGSAGENGVIVLDFGKPEQSGSTYGASLFGFGFRSTAQIETAVKQFLRGYWDCSPSGAYIVLAIGTSNCGPPVCGPSAVNNAHGQAWAQMVNNVATWISLPPSYASKMSVAGANDIEMDFNTSTNTRAWVDGYDAVNNWPYYNFGDCAGCPYVLPSGGGCPSCTPNNGWTKDDVWYVSWGAPPAWPLPEIYRTDGVNAWQWQRMSLYSYENHGARMYIKGSFTQWAACQGTGGTDIQCRNDGLDNRPEAGYLQLYNALSSNPNTTLSSLPWSTDITDTTALP